MVKNSKFENDDFKKKFALFFCFGGTEVEHLTCNHKTESSNPATDTWREKMAKTCSSDILLSSLLIGPCCLSRQQRLVASVATTMLNS